MEIKHKITGSVLFESNKKTIKEFLVEAISKGADLEGADFGSL